MPALMTSVPPGGGECTATPTALLVSSLFAILNHKTSSSFPGTGAWSWKHQLAVVPSAWQSNKGSPFCEVSKSCPTLCDPGDRSLPGSPVQGVSRQECWGGLPFPPLYSSKSQSPCLYLASVNKGHFFSNTHTKAKRCRAALKIPRASMEIKIPRVLPPSLPPSLPHSLAHSLTCQVIPVTVHRSQDSSFLPALDPGRLQESLGSCPPIHLFPHPYP